MPGSEEGRSFFLALASGRWNSSESMGRDLPAMKRRIHRAYALIRLAAWHAAGRDGRSFRADGK